jgi:cystathionine gamma-synthase
MINSFTPADRPKLDDASTRSDSPTTRAVRIGINDDPSFGAVVPPIVLSANFSFADFAEPRRYDYTRSGNPTRDLLATALAEMEGGAGSVITATGMAAITLVTKLLPAGARVVIPHDCYGGTWRLFDAFADQGWLETFPVDLTNADYLDSINQVEPHLVWIETPSNPLLRTTDLELMVTNAKRAGAITVVDNTFLTPLLQTPLAYGADLVVHSTTKYVNGHSDVVGGAVVAKTQELYERLQWWANVTGVTGSPFDSYLTLRGLRTLDARLRVHQENAAHLAESLYSHPAVSRVYYPGLASDPGHELAKRQQQGFGAVVSFELAGGVGVVPALLRGLRHFTLAESLGGVESLIAHPATMTHASMTPEARAVAGVGDGLLRLSVGIENADDLNQDLIEGLNRVSAAGEDKRQHSPVHPASLAAT